MSFPRQSLSAEPVGVNEVKKEGLNVFLLREIVAVTVWSLSVPLLAFVMIRLIAEANQVDLRQREGDPRVAVAILAWLLVQLLPTKLKTSGAPGFLFSQFWVLLRVEESFGRYPNFGCRICDWMLGRITKHALFLAFFVHTTVPYAVWGALSLFWPECSLPHRSSHYELRYEDDSNKQIMTYFFLQELVANALFPIALMVVPVLLKLNDFPEWLTLLVLYPVYSIGVDWDGRGSTLSAAAFVTQSIMLERFHFKENWRLLAQLLGNLFAGIVMQNIFPDEPAL